MRNLTESRAREHEALLILLKSSLKAQNISSLLCRNVALKLDKSYRRLEWRRPELILFLDARVAASVTISRRRRYEIAGREDLSGRGDATEVAGLIAASLGPGRSLDSGELTPDHSTPCRKDEAPDRAEGSGSAAENSRTMELLGEVDLLGRLGSVTIARTYARGLLLSTGHRNTDDVELLTGEIFANAVSHSESGRRPGGVVTLRVYDDGETVRVEVTDEGSTGGIPRIPAQVDPLSEGGRGLWLVRELSSAWGWGQDGGRRTVWFEVRV
ncbi:ATP-binding protein [Sphaerisporangium fuscum]|uniref:ATP-binding protein n=1 Tax=Sphaerisporangium fuscum TaxID=2835868 RepID=UPI001BDCDC41|nr:ATP-binding protein [Sphaerisporangium fuscum]